MFPAGIFFLFMAVLDLHNPGVPHWQIVDSRGGMNYYECSNLQMYFKDHPVREMDDGSIKYITAVECIKQNGS